MPRYNDFKTLRADVHDAWDGFEQLLDMFDWSIFSNDGAVKAQGYEVLSDAFRTSRTKEDVAKEVAEEVYRIKDLILRLRAKTDDPEAKADADEQLALAKWLIDYMKSNFEEEIILDHPELTHSFIQGC